MPPRSSPPRAEAWVEPGAPPHRHPWAEAPLPSALGPALPVSRLVGPGAALRLRLIPSAPQPRAPAAAQARVLARPGVFDGPVVGLRRASLEHGLLHGVLSVGRWANARALEAGSGAHAGGRLAPLEESGRANDLGIILLVVDPNDRVWVARRAKGLGLRGGRWSATASGGLEPTDGPAAGVWTERHIQGAALRELQEETGLRPSAVEPPALLGIVREWRRGGKPEAVLWARARRPLPGVLLRPSDEISVLRAIPIEQLRAEAQVWAGADLTLRLSLSLLIDARGPI